MKLKGYLKKKKKKAFLEFFISSVWPQKLVNAVQNDTFGLQLWCFLSSLELEISGPHPLALYE